MSDRKTRRQFLKGSGGAAITSVLAGCLGGSDKNNASGGTNGGVSTASGGDKNSIKIGVSTYVQGGIWNTVFNESARLYNKANNNVTVDLVPNQQSASKQVQDIRQFVNQGYDGIVARIWSGGTLESAINYADKQGVPVFTVDADTTSQKSKMFVGFDSLAGARLAGKRMVKKFKNDKPNKDTWHVLNVRGPQGNQTANKRSQGFMNVAKKNDRIKVAKTINAEFTQTQAKKKVSQWLSSNGKVDGIFSANGAMGVGSESAVEQQGFLKKKEKDGHIVLTQMDGNPQVLSLVEKGYIDTVVDQPNYFYLPITIKYLQKYLNNGEKALPKVDTKVTKSSFHIKPHNFTISGEKTMLWNTPIWSPAQVIKQNGHRWFQTNSAVITQQNASKPYLWGNIWSNL